MSGTSHLRKLAVLVLFSVFSTSLFAQDVYYDVSVQANADAAEPSTNGSFTVSLDRPLAEDYSAAQICLSIGGTATPGSDYVNLDPGESPCPFGQYAVWLNQGEMSEMIDVSVIDDSIYEGEETVTLTIEDVDIYCDCSETLYVNAPSPGQAIVTIDDDDDNAEFTVYAWFNDGNPLPVDVSLSCTGATVDQATRQASNSSPAIFTLNNVTPGNTCTTSYSLVSGYSNNTYNCTAALVSPTDSEYCYVDFYYETVSVDVRRSGTASEPDRDGAYELVLSGSPPWGGMDVNVSIGGTATPGSDYEELAEVVNVPYGATRHRVPIMVIDDEDKEDTETVIVNVLEPTVDICQEGLYQSVQSKRPGGKSKTQENGCDPYYAPGATTEATINVYDDDHPKVSLSSTGDAAEPDTAGGLLLTVEEPVPEGGIQVHLSVEGTATAGVDYQALTTPVLIPAGATEAEVPVVPIDDEEMEPTETVAVLLLPGNGYRIGGGNEIRATVSILDDDDSPPEPPVTPNLSVSPSSGLVTDEDGGTAEFEVVLTAQPEMEIGVVFESSDTTEGTVSPMSVTFGTENWNVPQTITVTGQSDEEEDGDQPYTIMLTPSEAYEGNTPPNVSVTNMDKTPPPEPATAAFTQAVYTVAEADGVAQVSVKRMGNPDVALTAFVSTLDDSGDTTATAGEDYTSVSDAEVSWAAGDTEDKVVEITVFENTDTITGKNEKVALSLTGEGIDEMASLEIESDVGDDIVGGISDELVPPNQQEIVSVILDTCPLGGNADDFQGLCTALVFSAADGNSVANAIKAATPDDAAAVRSSGMQTTNVQVTAIDGRLGTIRGGGGAGFSASGFSMAYGDVSMSGSLLKSFINAFDQQSPEFMQANANAQDDSSAIDEFGRWGAWVSGRVVFGEKDPTTNQIDYDFDTAGITFGLDYRFTDEMVAGVAVGYSNTDAKLGSNNGELDSKGYSVAAYGTWFKGDSFYMGGSLGYGSNEYDHLRNVRYTIDRPDVGSEFLPDSVFNVDQTLAADYDGSQYSASISGGWDFNKDGWTFGPTLRVSYVNVDVDAYDEFLLSSNMDPNFATGGWAVHIDKQSYESLQPSLGFEFTKAVSASWGVFIPQGYVDVVSELSDGGQLVTGQFIGDNNGARFALETDDFEETFVRAGLGFGLILKNNKSAYLMVDGDFGRDLLSTYYINAGFRWQF